MQVLLEGDSTSGASINSGATSDADCASKKSNVPKEPDAEIGEMSHSSAIAVNANANQSDNESDDGEWKLKQCPISNVKQRL